MFRFASHLLPAQSELNDYRVIQLDEARLQKPEGIREFRFFLRKLRKSQAAEIVWLSDDFPQMDYVQVEEEKPEQKSGNSKTSKSKAGKSKSGSLDDPVCRASPVGIRSGSHRSGVHCLTYVRSRFHVPDLNYGIYEMNMFAKSNMESGSSERRLKTNSIRRRHWRQNHPTRFRRDRQGDAGVEDLRRRRPRQARQARGPVGRDRGTATDRAACNREGASRHPWARRLNRQARMG